MGCTGGRSSSSPPRLGPTLVVTLLVTAMASGGEGPPATPPSLVQLRMQDSSVIVSDSFGKELVIRHAPGSHLVPKNQNLPRAGGMAFYGHSCYLMIVKADVTDAAQVKVKTRVVYPGSIQSIVANEGGLSVTVTVLMDEGDTNARRYRYPPLADEPYPTVFPLDEAAFAAPMIDALKRVPGLRRDGSIIEDEREAAKSRVKLLQSDFAANPTNPWFKLYEGVVLRGYDYAAARRAFRAAVDVEGAPAFDYLRMSALLASMGEMAESDVAFERGFAEFVRQGFEPELLMSRAAFERVYALHLDGPPEGPGTAHALAMAKAREAGDTEAMTSLAARIWRLAPRCEGATFAFAGIAERLQSEGQKYRADVWRGRAEAASRFAGPAGSRHVFYAGASCLAALLVLLAICFIKARSRQKKDLAPLGGWLGSWRWTWERFTKMAFAYSSRKELIGIFLVAVAGLFLSYTAIRAERSVFRASKLPEALKTGTWAHPRAVSYLDDLRTDPGRDANKLLYAISKQQETLNRISKEAKEAYEDLGGDKRLEAVAQNNTGVMLWESTDVAGAGARFRKAREFDPNLAEARYNDEDKDEGGGQVGSVRTSRARMYLRGRKLIALPDADMLAAAFAGTEAQGEAGDLVGGLGILKPVAWLTLALTAIVTVLVLPFLVMRRKAAPERRWGMLAGLGYVFPGTSSRLAPTGGMLLAAWVYCLIILVLVVQGDAAGGVNELGRIVESTFGVSGKIVFPFESVMMIFGPAAFVGLWVLNGVLLARATKLAKAMARAAAQPAESDDADDTDGGEDEDEVSEEVSPASADAEDAKDTEEVEQAGEDDEPSDDDDDDDEQEAPDSSNDKDEDKDKDKDDDKDDDKDSSPESPDETIMTPDLLKEPAPRKPAAPAAAKDEESKEKPVEKPVEKPTDKKKKSESAPAKDADADEDEDEDDYQPPL